VLRRIQSHSRHPYIRLTVLSAVTAAAAYGLATALPMTSATVAAVAALVSVRPTLHASMQEGLRQLLGVIIGAGVAFASLEFIGYSAVALFLAVLVCFAVAGVLRLGDEGAAAVGITVILVVGPHFSTVAIETRLSGVALGALLALIASFFLRPGTPHGRALADVVKEAGHAAGLLDTIAQALVSESGQLTRPMVQAWLADAQLILMRTVETRLLAQDAVSGARWSPMIDRRQAAAILEQVQITEKTAVAIVSLCRDLVGAASRDEHLSVGLATSFSDVLRATADAIEQQSNAARVSPAETLDQQTGPIRLAKRGRTEAAAHIRHLDDTRPLLLGGSLLRDAEKITEILSGNSK
jgi:uncharacterized membrane protein YgaE (UPF0421/DUF939 family)